MTNQTVSNNSQKNKVILESSPNIFDGATDLSKPDIKQHQKSVSKNNQKPSIFDGLSGIPVENVSPASSQENIKESLPTRVVEQESYIPRYSNSEYSFHGTEFLLGFVLAFAAIFVARKMFRN